MSDDKLNNGSDQVLNDPASFLFASLADFYRENMLFPEAIAMCQSGLEAQPDNIDGRLVLARCYLATGEPARAREELVKVLVRHSEHGDAKKLLAEIDRSMPVAPAAPAAPAPKPVAPVPKPMDTVLPSPPAAAEESGSDPPSIPAPALPVAATAKEPESPAAGYSRVLADLQQTPQVVACLLVDESGFVVSETYAGAVAGAGDSEASAALSVNIFKTAAEAMHKITLGALERVIVETATEKVFLRKAGPLLLLLSAEKSVKMGLVAVNSKRAVERIASLAKTA